MNTRHRTILGGLEAALRAADPAEDRAAVVQLARRLAKEADQADGLELIKYAPALLKTLEALGMARGRAVDAPPAATQAPDRQVDPLVHPDDLPSGLGSGAIAGARELDELRRRAQRRQALGD